jgi:glycosyltransferase involved in cell wall biosynthesis
MPSLHLLAPGDLATLTGGYAYDRRIVAGLRALGWDVRIHTLDSSFPFPTVEALEHADRTLAGIDAGALALIDGLALGAMPSQAQAHGARLKLVALVHHPLCMETGLTPAQANTLRASEREALRHVRKVIATSEATGRGLRDFDVEAERVAVVEPGTDTASPSPWRGNGKVQMLCVATITPRKGHGLLIEVLSSLRQFAWHLTCVGSLTRDRETAAALRAQLLEEQLSERVTLTGEVNEAVLAAYYANTDVFVLATLYEGYGMAVAEACAYGLPVISTSTGAIPEIVHPGAGVLVPPGDRAALQSALHAVLRNAGLRGDLASQARRVASALPTWDDTCRRFDACLREIADERV